MDFERIYDKLEGIDDKLDQHIQQSHEHRVEAIERISKVEARQNTVSGQIKLIMGFVISGVSAFVTWVIKQIYG